MASFFFGPLLLTVSSCKKDNNAPPIENEEEIITDVFLIFTPAGGGMPMTVVAKDPDGEGPQSLQSLQDITLIQNTTYTLEVFLQNTLVGTDITTEVRKEKDEHMFFFEWPDGLFANPSGNGNVDNRNDLVNYKDQDGNGFPLGLSTSWETGGASFGRFRIVLKHQPSGIKTASSTVNDGETDVDLTWNLSVR